MPNRPSSGPAARLSIPSCLTSEPAILGDVSAAHFEIVAAIDRRDEDAAAQAMRNVILYGQRRVSAIIS